MELFHLWKYVTYKTSFRKRACQDSKKPVLTLSHFLYALTHFLWLHFSTTEFSSFCNVMPSRNQQFASHDTIHESNLQHSTSRVTGPFSFFNPTAAHVHGTKATSVSSVKGAAFKWSSRNNRKGRHGLALSPTLDASDTPTPKSTSSVGEILKGIRKMFTKFPIYDVSYLVATTFTLGSIVWIINAFFSFLPYTDPSTEFSTEVLYGGGITAFIGATIFEIGSVLLMIEAVNENRAECFGWAVEQLFDEVGGKAENAAQIKRVECNHHHANKWNFVGRGPSGSKTLESGASDSSGSPQIKPQGQKVQGMGWRWFPSWKELRTHYLRDIGFLACSSQMFGATIFWIAGFTALPGIYNHLDVAETNGVYWTPQVIGGTGFVVSGILFMIETQKKWYMPAPKVLGWHIGLWNFIGGVGFTLCPIFGFSSINIGFQAACSTFWGSWAFMIGSTVQCEQSPSIIRYS